MSTTQESNQVSDPLLQLAQKGDRAALEALLTRFAPAIYRFSLRMCKNQEDAEDTLQDTLLSVSTHLDDFAGKSSLLSWIFALTRSACVRRRRGLKNQAHDSFVEEHAGTNEGHGQPDPEQQAHRRELADVLQEGLAQLAETEREALLLRDVEGLSADEAAEALGISVAALKSRLHRARRSLRDLLMPVLMEEKDQRPGCPDIAKAWSEKLEGDLSATDCTQMEAHLAGCPSCSVACDALRKTLRVCQRAGEAEVSLEVQAQVKAALRLLSAGRSPEYR